MPVEAGARILRDVPADAAARARMAGGATRAIAVLLLLLPAAAVVLYAAPLVTFQLPNYESTISEEYQPIKALSFFSSRGRAFAKWGPIDNFLLAPGYAVTLLYWRLTGALGPVSPDFPYGFTAPLEQLTFLVLQSRIVLLAWGLAAMLGTAALLLRAKFSAASVSAALFLCVATNPVLVSHLVILKPDAPMIAFLSLAIGVYTLCVRRGLTTRRAVAFGACAALAVSSKEIAGPLFVLPCAALGARALWWRPDERTTAGVGALVGVGTYVAANVWYAPLTWWERVRYWLADSGADAAVWGQPHRTALGYAQEIGTAVLGNLGPGGALVVVVALMMLLVGRPPGAAQLALPTISFVVLGLLPVGYAPDYFCVPLAVALVPLVACALEHARSRAPWRRWPAALTAVVALAAVSNAVHGNRAWIDLDANVGLMAERHALANLPRGTRVAIFSLWWRTPGKSRLDRLGYPTDGRTAGQLVRSRKDLPEILYVDPALRLWIHDMASMPRRADMARQGARFDYESWPGFEGLGYRLVETIEPAVPAWWPFGWMPRGIADNRLGLLVYRAVESPKS